jgi:NSS family neurotransmitter:Na+ symporter
MEERKARFTKWGFILATVGSAVGLGNIWKFPYITGEYGGGAFVIVYLFTILFVGLSLLVAEMFLGHFGKSDAVTTFERVGNGLQNKKPSLKYAGFMAFNGLIIMTFYSVVIGWIFYYIYSAFNGLPTTVSEAETEFKNLIGENIEVQILFHTIATLTVLHFINGGIKQGIEKLNNILMPTLFIIILGLLIYSINLESFSKSFHFLFYPDWSKLNSEAFIRAVGHSFFTLSLGMGAILTYSASVPNRVSITKSALMVGFFDTLIALMAGLIIFTLLFHFNEEPSKGPGLVFVTMPVIFQQLGDIGVILAILFLSALGMAGLTSAVSLVEPAVLYLVNRFSVSRFKSTIFMGTIYWLIGIFSILSYSNSYGADFSIFGTPIFDILETTTDSILLPVSGIIIALAVGYGVRKVDLKKIENEMGGIIFKIWLFSIRVIVPISIIFFMLNLFGIVKL